MKALHFSIITTLCTLALSGCSSSSGGSEANSSLFITQDPYKNTQTPNNTSSSSSSTNTAGNTHTVVEKINIFNPQLVASVNPTELSGSLLAVKADGTTSHKALHNYRSEELDEIVVDGTHVRLFNVQDKLSGNGLDGFKPLSDVDVIEGKNGTVSGYAGGYGNIFHYMGFRNTRFGVYTANNQDHLFVQGYATPLSEIQKSRNEDLYPMPTNGRYTYRTGQALYGKNGSYEQLSTSAVADFDSKTLNVTLSGSSNLQFSATIEGNGFSGDSQGIQSKGLFYGDRADEIGGIFYQTEGNDKGKGGVFGARNPRRETQ